MSETPPPTSVEPTTAPRRRSVALVRSAVILALALLLVTGAAGIWLWSKRPRLAREEIRDVAHAAIQRETPASFLVTGILEVTTSTRVSNTRTLLGLELGTTSATLRVPGRISYGIDVRRITPEMITVHEDGVVEVEIPDPELFQLEPVLAEIEMETERGWARLSNRTPEQVRQRALELVQPTMRAQGERHLRDSVQPRINTANALYEMLRPALVAAGVPEPELRFRLGRVLVVEPGRR